jgi:signal transduction histidine kinase
VSEGRRAFASVPLSAKNEVLGAINIASLKPYQFSPRDMQLLTGIAASGIAVENAKLHQEVRLQDITRGELLREIFSIQEEERKRIARELHDETSQVVVSLSTSLEAISNLLPHDINGAIARLKIAQAISLNILDGLHRLIYELRPSLLDDLGLVSAVRWLVENSSNKHGINVIFARTGRTKRLPSQIETTIFRVIQEAVSNITKACSLQERRE